MTSWPRLWRTLKQLQPSQLLWRTRYLAERKLPPAWQRSTLFAGGLNQSVEYLLAEDFPDIPLFHRAVASDLETVSEIAKGRFTHLHQTVAIDPQLPDWKHGGASAGRLWQITWHYHEWVFALAECASRGDHRALPVLKHWLERWLLDCQLRKMGGGHLSWNSFAIATRLGWWIRAWHILGPQRLTLLGNVANDWRSSIAEQARFLFTHLEWDLRANHLLRDAVGLAWAGRFLEGTEPDRWLHLATKIAVTQSTEQLCADGGHFERSPMYHVHVMEDFLTLVFLMKDQAAVQQMRETLKKMADALRWMCHRDGQITQFNDAALHHVCDPDRIISLCDAPQGIVHSPSVSGGKHLPETGFIRWASPNFDLFFDVGPVGPDCQPGHAHADSLTVEIDVHGDRLIVDSGTFGYDNDERRRYDRSTAAHNTVCVDQQDSSEVWHIFRVGRRAKATVVEAVISDSACQVSAEHDGYSYLAGSPWHRRTIHATNSRILITDRIEGTGTHELSGGWLLDPRWTAIPTADGWRIHKSSETKACCELKTEVTATITVSATNRFQHDIAVRPYHPEFSVEISTQRLCWSFQGNLPFEIQTEFVISPLPEIGR